MSPNTTSFCTIGYNAGNETFVTNPNGISASGNTGTWAGNTQNMICLRWEGYTPTGGGGGGGTTTVDVQLAASSTVDLVGNAVSGFLLYQGIFMFLIITGFILTYFRKR